MATYKEPIRVGIVGTGGIGRGLAKLLARRRDFRISGILTRRRGIIENLGLSQDLVTQHPEKIMESSDVGEHG